jgi:hypothetical protein
VTTKVTLDPSGSLNRGIGTSWNELIATLNDENVGTVEYLGSSFETVTEKE